MARLLTIEPIDKSPTLNFFKKKWELLQSFDKFTKLMVVTFFLIILSTPFIVANTQIFNPKAEEQATCPSLPGEQIGEKPNKERAEFVAGLLDSKTRDLSKTLLEHRNASGDQKSQLTGQLLKLAKERKSFLIEAMRKNPDAALNSVLFLTEEERAPLAALSQGCVETVATLEGTLEILHADFFEEKVSKTLYTIKTAQGERIDIHPTRGLNQSLLSGQKVRVKGYRVDNDLLFDGTAPDSITILQEISFSLIKEAQAAVPGSLGNQQTVVLMANFQNTTQPSLTKTGVDDVVFTQMNNYYTEVSYNKTSIAGTSYGWYTIPLDAGCSGTDAVRDAAVKAADADVFFPNYSRLIIIVPFGSSCAAAGFGTIGKKTFSTADGNVSMSVAWIDAEYVKLWVVGHEFGHNLGVHHANFLYCGDQTITIDKVGCTNYEYRDPYDIMGDGRAGDSYVAHMNAPHKNDIGWFDSSNIINITSSGTYTIEPLETATAGPKALKIQRALNEYLFLEYRQPIGYDAYFSFMSGIDALDGALLHTSTFSNIQTLLLDATPSVDPNEVLVWQYKSALLPGQSFTDPKTGTKVTVTGKTASALTINIVVGNLDFDGPNIAITSPKLGSTISGLVNVTADATDPSGVDRVEFYLYGPGTGWPGIHFGTDTQAPYEATLDTTQRPNGWWWNIYAHAYDLLGNKGDTSVGVWISNGVTPTPTGVVFPTATPTSSPLPTSTPTPSLTPPTPTPTPTPTPLPTATPTPTSTPIPTPTSIPPTPTPTFTPTPIPTSTPIPTPTPPQTVTIQGRHKDVNGNDLVLSGQKITLNTGATSSSTPSWFFNTLTPGTYTVTANPIAGYTISFAACINCAPPSNSYTNGNTLTVNLPINGNYADIYFKYTSATDTTKPTVSITSPVNGSKVSRNSTVTISASATDNVGVTRVEFLVNGTLSCTDTIAPYTCAWRVPNAPNKAYTLLGRAYDAAFNTNTHTVSVTSAK